MSLSSSSPDIVESAGAVDLDIKLIDLVRANPMLYQHDLRSSPYETHRKQMEVWKSVGMSLGVDAKYCILRWKNLRSRFRYELEKLHELVAIANKTSSGDNGVGGGGGVNGEKKPEHHATWKLLDRMRFLEHHIKYYGQHNTKVQLPQIMMNASWNKMDAEQLVETVFEDDPLQEAMDDQCVFTTNMVTSTTNNALSNTDVPPVTQAQTQTQTQLTHGLYAHSTVNMVRMEVLLETLDAENRSKAEKRIVAYLCKCQLKSLCGESVDDIIV